MVAEVGGRYVQCMQLQLQIWKLPLQLQFYDNSKRWQEKTTHWLTAGQTSDHYIEGRHVGANRANPCLHVAINSGPSVFTQIRWSLNRKSEIQYNDNKTTHDNKLYFYYKHQM